MFQKIVNKDGSINKFGLDKVNLKSCDHSQAKFLRKGRKSIRKRLGFCDHQNIVVPTSRGTAQIYDRELYFDSNKAEVTEIASDSMIVSWCL